MAISEAEVHQVLGKLAVSFSALEYNVRIMLQRLVGGNVWVGPLLINPLQFAQVIQRCRKAAESRYIKDPARLREAKDLLNRADALREVRNLFIHGQWIIGLASNTVSVFTFRLRYNERDDLWEYLEDRRIAMEELHDRQDDVDAMIKDVKQFNEYIQPRQ